MVNDIRLYIDKELVEFKETPEIYYNWCETDFSNPVVTKNSYSKTITVEGTKQNNKIFGHFWNLERYQLYGGNTGVDFNPSYKVPFTLYVDGNLFEKGYVKLQKVTKKNGVFQYEIGLFGGLGSFLYNLSINEEDGSTKTFNSLNFYFDNELVDYSFNIDKETVKEAWDNINNTSSKWHNINFAPAYTGIPDKFDANKVLINFNGFSASTLPQDITEDNKHYTYQAGGYAIGELSDSIDEWQAKDLRSYLQTPVIRVKTIFDALQRKENSKGKFDEGYDLVLDEEFFNSNNPYYADAFITLPKITTLTFTPESGETEVITGYTSSTEYSEYGATENTTITFTLPQTVSKGGVKAVIKYYLYDTVTRGYTHPTVQALYMQPTYIENYTWKSENRTALGAQLLALANNDAVLNGSNISWYTSVNFDGVYFSCMDAINYGTYNPVFPTSVINKRTGFYQFVETAATGSIYQFNSPIELEVDLPAGTKKVALNLQRCAELGEGAETMSGTKLYPYGYRDTVETTCFGSYNSDLSSGSTTVVTGGGGESNFFSHRFVNQKDLFTTDYSVADWLISYCKMFGLYIHKDLVEDKIYIDTRNTYYQKESIEDISELIDYSKDIIINPVYASNKFYTLTQPMETTKYGETYKSNNGNTYGMKLINTGYEFDANRKELLDNYKLKTGIPVNRQDIYNFKPLNFINPYVYNGFTYKLYQNGDIDYENTYDVEIPKKQIAVAYKDLFFNNDYPYYDAFYKMCFMNEGKEVNPSSCFLFYNGLQYVNAYGYYLTDDLGIMSKLNNNPCWIMTQYETTTGGTSVGINLDYIPLFSSYYTIGADIKFSSNFGSPRELFVRDDELINHDEATLYSQFYSSYYEDMYDINTKVVDCYVKPKYILNADNLRKFYWFNNGIWRLNKIIDYSPVENRTVKCQFVKIQDLNAISSEIPSKSAYIRVTLSKYNVDATGETITGTVFVSDFSSWEYIGSDVSGVTVTPTGYTTGCDIQVTIPSYEGYSDNRTITLNFAAGEATASVTLTQAVNYFMHVTPNGSYPYEVEANATVIMYTVNCNPGCTVYLKDASGNTIYTQHFNTGSYRNQTFGISANTATTPVLYYVYAESDRESISPINNLVTQKGLSYSFIWNDTQTSATTANVNSAATTATKTYTTNMSGLTFVVDDSLVTGYTLNGNEITAHFTTNTGLTARTGYINVIYSGNTVGTFDVTQNAQELYFYWNSTQTSADTEYVDSGDTYVSVGYSTNMSNLSFVVDGSVVTGYSDNNRVLTALFNENPEFSSRTGYINVYNSGNLVGELTVIQNDATLYFYWDSTHTSAITINVNSDDISETVGCTTNISGQLSFSYDGTVVTGGSANNNNSYIYVDIDVNSSIDSRNGYLEVIYNNTVYGVINVHQYGEGVYFYWNDTLTTATTANVGSGDSATTKYFTTNLPNLSATHTGFICGSTVNGNAVNISFVPNQTTTGRTGTVSILYNGDVVGVVEVNQGAERYFIWNETQTSATTGTVESAATVLVKGCTTNVDDFVFVPNGFVTTGSINSDCTEIIITFTENPSATTRPGSLTICDGNDPVGVIYLTQNPRAYHFDWVGHGPTWITTVGSGDTAFTAEYYSDYPSISFVGNSNVTSIDDSVPDYMTVYFTANPSIVARTIRVSAVTNNEVVGELELTQEPQPPYFNWNGGGSAETQTVGSASTSFNLGFSTNMPNLSASHTGFICGATIQDNRIYVTYSQNTSSSSDRTGMVTITYNGNTVGTLDITQTGKVYFYWNGGSESASTTVAGEATYTSKLCTTNCDDFVFVGTGIVTAGTINANRTEVTAYFTINPSASTRTGTLAILDNDTPIGYLYVTQEGKQFYYELYNPDTGEYVPSLMTSAEKTDTGLTVSYITNYDLSEISYSGNSYVTGFDTSTPDEVTIQFGQNYGRTRTILVTVYNSNNEELADIEITQLGT